MSGSDFSKIRSEAGSLKYRTDSGAYRKIGMGRRLFTWILNVFRVPFGMRKIDLVETCYQKSLQGLARQKASQVPLGKTHTCTPGHDEPVTKAAVEVLRQPKPFVVLSSPPTTPAATTAPTGPAEEAPKLNVLNRLKKGESITKEFTAEEFMALLPSQDLGITRAAVAKEYARGKSSSLEIEGLSFDVPNQLIVDVGRGDHRYAFFNGKPWLDIERAYYESQGKKAPDAPKNLDLEENQKNVIIRMASTAAHMDKGFDTLSPTAKQERLQNILTGLFFFVQNFEAPLTTYTGLDQNLLLRDSSRTLSLIIDNDNIRSVVRGVSSLIQFDDISKADYSLEMERSTSIIKDDPALVYLKATYLPEPARPLLIRGEHGEVRFSMRNEETDS